MSAAAYYNEIDQFAAQWLRNLIAAGHIAPGEVDERSIEDVTPDDLSGFTQCHFFAGIGVWSHSLRLAGWPDDRPVWTGSCPCQPFSAAGKGDGFADERHLWPHFFHLISECGPQHVFGEQVASGNANTWFDLVQADLEGMGYAFGLVPFTSAGIGAPHIRERAYWVAHASSGRYDRRTEASGQEARTGAGIAISCGIDGVAYANMQHQSATGNTPGAAESGGCGKVIRVADAGFERCHGVNSLLQRKEPGRDTKSLPEASRDRSADWLGNANVTRLEGLCGNDVAARRERETGPVAAASVHLRPLEVNGFWRDADWLFCRDGKWRPVEPGTFPLVDGAAARLGRVEPGVARVASSNRVGRLKGYGNAINAQAAAAFIRAYMGVA